MLTLRPSFFAVDDEQIQDIFKFVDTVEELEENDESDLIVPRPSRWSTNQDIDLEQHSSLEVEEEPTFQPEEVDPRDVEDTNMPSHLTFFKLNKLQVQEDDGTSLDELDETGAPDLDLPLPRNWSTTQDIDLEQHSSLEAEEEPMDQNDGTSVDQLDEAGAPDLDLPVPRNWSTTQDIDLEQHSSLEVEEEPINQNDGTSVDQLDETGVPDLDLPVPRNWSTNPEMTSSTDLSLEMETQQ